MWIDIYYNSKNLELSDISSPLVSQLVDCWIPIFHHWRRISTSNEGFTCNHHILQDRIHIARRFQFLLIRVGCRKRSFKCLFEVIIRLLKCIIHSDFAAKSWSLRLLAWLFTLVWRLRNKLIYFEIEKTLICCCFIFYHDIFLLVFRIWWVGPCHQGVGCFGCCLYFIVRSDKIVDCDMYDVPIDVIDDIGWLLFFSLLRFPSFQNRLNFPLFLFFFFNLFDTIINHFLSIISPSIRFIINLLPC